jgi:hypothetical protein
MNKIFALFTLSFLMVLSVSMASAATCGYGDHSGCKVTETIVEGRIYFADSNQSAGGAQVTVICNHGGTEYKRSTVSLNSNALRGTYAVIFPQTQCIAGDEVSVSAVKDGSTGQEDGTVRHWITLTFLDVDVGIIDVPLVPEFGLYAGALTLMGAAGVFFLVRRK